MSPTPTIREVARRAGVAPITVSRVINHSGYVSQEVRARVEAVIAELGYVPNTLARSLRSRRTNTLALVLTDITNPFWTTVARGVEDAASSTGFNVILCNSDESEDKQDRYLHVLLQKRVDGVLLVPVHSSAAPVDLVQRQNTPIVVIDRRIRGIQADTVRCDSEGGAYELTRLLLTLGHRRIAMLSGPLEVSTAAERVAGYRRALAEAGLSDEAEQVYQGEFTLTSGYEMARDALAAAPRATALFAANNFIAIGALKLLKDAGLRVPEDMAVVGFDDLPQAMIVEPFLTVAAQPAYAMGQRATEVLLARLDGQLTGAYQEIVLPTQLIVRHSSGEQPRQNRLPLEGDTANL